MALCRCDDICVDVVDYRTDAQPDAHVGKNIHDTALVRKGRFLKDRQTFHQLRCVQHTPRFSAFRFFLPIVSIVSLFCALVNTAS